MNDIIQYLKDIRRATIYAALFLKDLKGKRVEAIEDQICDIDQTLERHLSSVSTSLSLNQFNTDNYWHDQEVKVSFLYLQDLIFEFPEEDPSILGKKALNSARQAIAAIKSEFN